jgi:hypothetical protein
MSSGILGAVDGVIVKGVGVAVQNVLSFDAVRTLYSRIASELHVEVTFLACCASCKSPQKVVLALQGTGHKFIARSARVDSS